MYSNVSCGNTLCDESMWPKGWFISWLTFVKGCDVQGWCCTFGVPVDTDPTRRRARSVARPVENHVTPSRGDGARGGRVMQIFLWPVTLLLGRTQNINRPVFWRIFMSPKVIKKARSKTGSCPIAEVKLRNIWAGEWNLLIQTEILCCF